MDSGGRLVQGQFGVKAGKRFKKFGLFAKARPGLLSFSDVFVKTGTERVVFNGVPFTFDTFDIRRKNFFSLDVGGVLELYPSRRVLVRFDAGDTMVDVDDFLPLPGGATPPGRGMKHRFQFSSGIAFRFVNPDGDQEPDSSKPDRERKFELGAQFSSLSLNVFSHIELPQLGLSFNETHSGFGGNTMIHYSSTRVPFFSLNMPSLEVPANTTHQFQFSAGVGFRL